MASREARTYRIGLSKGIVVPSSYPYGKENIKWRLLQTSDFLRIGSRRELKKALESYWSGKSSEADLLAVGKTLRNKHWTLQKQLGIEHIPSNDFSLYDHVLDTAAMVGAVPSRYGWSGGIVDQFTYFAMARGFQKKGVELKHRSR